jgi:hypothetical protein
MDDRLMHERLAHLSRSALAAVVATLLLLAPGLAAAIEVEPPSIRNLSAAQIASLKKGDTIRSMDTNMPFRGEVNGLIQAPVEELAAILRDYPKQTQWAPSMAEMRLIRREGEFDILGGVTDLPWPVPDRTWNMRAWVGYKTVSGRRSWVNLFKYVPGSGNMNESAGYWVLSALPDDPSWTYCRYVLYGDPGIPLPDFVIRWASRTTLPAIMSSLRKQHARVYGTKPAAAPASAPQ